MKLLCLIGSTSHNATPLGPKRSRCEWKVSNVCRRLLGGLPSPILEPTGDLPEVPTVKLGLTCSLQAPTTNHLVVLLGRSPEPISGGGYKAQAYLNYFAMN